MSGKVVIDLSYESYTTTSARLGGYLYCGDAKIKFRCVLNLDDTWSLQIFNNNTHDWHYSSRFSVQAFGYSSVANNEVFKWMGENYDDILTLGEALAW